MGPLVCKFWGWFDSLLFGMLPLYVSKHPPPLLDTNNYSIMCTGKWFFGYFLPKFLLSNSTFWNVLHIFYFSFISFESRLSWMLLDIVRETKTHPDHRSTIANQNHRLNWWFRNKMRRRLYFNVFDKSLFSSSFTHNWILLLSNLKTCAYTSVDNGTFSPSLVQMNYECFCSNKLFIHFFLNRKNVW